MIGRISLHEYKKKCFYIYTQIRFIPASKTVYEFGDLNITLCLRILLCKLGCQSWNCPSIIFFLNLLLKHLWNLRGKICYTIKKIITFVVFIKLKTIYNCSYITFHLTIDWLYIFKLFIIWLSKINTNYWGIDAFWYNVQKQHFVDFI